MSDAVVFAFDLVAIPCLAYGVYFPRHRRRDLVVAYLGRQHRRARGRRASSSADAVGLGLGLGLFGVLSIIRLRSSRSTSRRSPTTSSRSRSGCSAACPSHPTGSRQRSWRPAGRAMFVGRPSAPVRPLPAPDRHARRRVHRRGASSSRRLEQLLGAEVRQVVVTRSISCATRPSSTSAIASSRRRRRRSTPAATRRWRDEPDDRSVTGRRRSRACPPSLSTRCWTSPRCRPASTGSTSSCPRRSSSSSRCGRRGRVRDRRPPLVRLPVDLLRRRPAFVVPRRSPRSAVAVQGAHSNLRRRRGVHARGEAPQRTGRDGEAAGAVPDRQQRRADAAGRAFVATVVPSLAVDELRPVLHTTYERVTLIDHRARARLTCDAILVGSAPGLSTVCLDGYRAAGDQVDRASNACRPAALAPGCPPQRRSASTAPASLPSTPHCRPTSGTGRCAITSPGPLPSADTPRRLRQGIRRPRAASLPEMARAEAMVGTDARRRPAATGLRPAITRR